MILMMLISFLLFCLILLLPRLSAIPLILISLHHLLLHLRLRLRLHLHPLILIRTLLMLVLLFTLTLILVLPLLSLHLNLSSLLRLLHLPRMPETLDLPLCRMSLVLGALVAPCVNVLEVMSCTGLSPIISLS